MLTVNALAAANRIIIPVQAEYLPAKGLEQLLSTVSKVKRQINPKLQIDGILLTMVDNRTNFAKEIAALLRDTYGSKIKVFGTEIPHSVRAKEISAEGKSIFAHDPGGKVAEGYRNLTKDCLLYTSALGAADAGRQLCLGDFMFLHKLLHPLPDIAGQIGSLHVTHLSSENSLYPLYLIKPARANAFRWLRRSEALHFCKISGRHYHAHKGSLGLPCFFIPFLRFRGSVSLANKGFTGTKLV